MNKAIIGFIVSASVSVLSSAVFASPSAFAEPSIIHWYNPSPPICKKSRRLDWEILPPWRHFVRLEVGRDYIFWRRPRKTDDIEASGTFERVVKEGYLFKGQSKLKQFPQVGEFWILNPKAWKDELCLEIDSNLTNNRSGTRR